MSAQLALPSYQPCPPDVAHAGPYFPEGGWAPQPEAYPAAPPFLPFQMPGAEKGRPDPELSPASSCSEKVSQSTPDSATSPSAHPSSPQAWPGSQAEEDQTKGQMKKSKIRTAFTQTQLNTLNRRFQTQKYLSPQQIRDLAMSLNLTYKQVKTWFQNQRMKSKRDRKDNLWTGRRVSMVQNGSLPATYMSLYSALQHSYLVNPATGNLPPWAGQAWASEPQGFVDGVGQQQQHPAEASQPFAKAMVGNYPPQQAALTFSSPGAADCLPAFPTDLPLAHIKAEDSYSDPTFLAAHSQFPDTSGLHLYQP
ncbi:homeobox protein NANOG [Ornithorhynchus anatinus]|uniref:homeobox protein NANOG n=1 Tax=Ornithorhynchus anatinus TaxID=9258 RepID=UPI0010A7A8D6|nr:homeobox protein NANOG [Ornithorhynchus anatinus]